MKLTSLTRVYSSRLAVYAFASISIFCLLLIGGLWTTWWSSSIANTTLRLEIIASFTWSVTYTGNTTLFINGIHRTTWANHTIILSSSTDVIYSSSWDIIESITWAIYFPTQYILPIQLTPGEWEKKVFITYTPLTWISEDQLPLPPVVYWVDITPPPLTTSYSWPPPTIDQYDPVSFTWDASVDTWVWLSYYSIQLSHSPTFSTAVEFTTTWTNLLLWGGSLSPGQRYRRRWATDLLWNSIYSFPISFTVLSSIPAPLWNGWTTSSIWIGNTSTPLSDQCPWGDDSWNYFDGICSGVNEPPVLLNVPVEHQAADFLPRREKIYNSLTEPKTTLYVFPNYEAPKALTIYEYTPNYVYNDIYEYADTSNKYPNLPYQPSFGVKRTSVKWHWEEFTSKFTWISTSRATSYLFYWFVQTQNSCSDVWQFCPQDPICWEAWSSCYFERNICLDKQTEINRCIRKK